MKLDSASSDVSSTRSKLPFPTKRQRDGSSRVENVVTRTGALKAAARRAAAMRIQRRVVQTDGVSTVPSQNTTSSQRSAIPSQNSNISSSSVKSIAQADTSETRPLKSLRSADSKAIPQHIGLKAQSKENTALNKTLKIGKIHDIFGLPKKPSVAPVKVAAKGSMSSSTITTETAKKSVVNKATNLASKPDVEAAAIKTGEKKAAPSGDNQETISNKETRKEEASKKEDQKVVPDKENQESASKKEEQGVISKKENAVPAPNKQIQVAASNKENQVAAPKKENQEAKSNVEAVLKKDVLLNKENTVENSDKENSCNKKDKESKLDGVSTEALIDETVSYIKSLEKDGVKPVLKGKQDDPIEKVAHECDNLGDDNQYWPIASRCHLMLSDLSNAFGEDWGFDNTHNTRCAQSSFCQVAYKSDRAHPGDYTERNTRLTAEQRDLIVAVIHNMAFQDYAPANSRDIYAFDSRVLAIVCVCVGLFDRFMSVISLYDARYGMQSDKPTHPLWALNKIPLILLNQLIGIVCYNLADRYESFQDKEYSRIVPLWKENICGMLKTTWPENTGYGSRLKSILFYIERVVLSYISPSASVAITPLSELAECLMSNAYLHAQSTYTRCMKRMLYSITEKQDKPQIIPGTEYNSILDKNPFDIINAKSKNASNTGSSGTPIEGVCLRVSTSDVVARVNMDKKYPDLARHLAQLLVRFALLERDIYLHYKPSVIISACVQLSIFPVGSTYSAAGAAVSVHSPDNKEDELAFNLTEAENKSIAEAEFNASKFAVAVAASALAAYGCSPVSKETYICQMLLLNKWVRIRQVLLCMKQTPHQSQNPRPESLPDWMLARWIHKHIIQSNQQRGVLVMLNQRANYILEHGALTSNPLKKGVVSKSKATKITESTPKDKLVNAMPNNTPFSSLIRNSSNRKIVNNNVDLSPLKQSAINKACRVDENSPPVLSVRSHNT